MAKIGDVGTLRELLEYDPDSGDFRWNIRPNGRVKIGSVAGSPDKDGYIRIAINGKKYFAHRLAWAFIYGEFPKVEIDHINRNTKDNRIENLRLSTTHQNSFNQGVAKNNTSGFKGVDWHKKSGKWRARIRHSGKFIHLGFFDCVHDAAKAYNDKAKLIHGDFYANTIDGVPDCNSVKMEAI